MKLHKFQTDSGKLLDAHFETLDGTLILRSRGGAFGSSTAQNTEYGPAFRLLLERIDQSNIELDGVWVDSNRVRKLPPNKRQIWSQSDSDLSPAELFTTLSRRMANVGRNPSSQSRGNPTKRLRFKFTGNPSAKLIEQVLGRGETDEKLFGRMLPQEKNLVSHYHIWHAVEQLLSFPSKYRFHNSTRYDVITDDGTRLPPKAVFRLAASDALGREVDSADFESDAVIRGIIEKAGFPVVQKNQQVDQKVVPLDSEEREWIEGGLKLVKHYRQERAYGLSKAKKEMFKRDHGGRLHCERCKMDPIEIYGSSFGEACIEVHHKRPLAARSTQRETDLNDVMCVCANCHRIIHRELSNL